MRKYSLQYIECLTINKSLKKFSNSGACFNQRKQSVAYSERKYQRRIFLKELTAFSKKLHLKCLKGSEYTSDAEA